MLDERTESARIPSVPEPVCELFSKRVRDGEAAAREYVAAQGLDWDAMHPMELFGVLKGGARATRRQKETGQRGDDLSDVAAWKAQAKAFGYEHRTVVDRDARNRLPAPEADRLRRAYLASLPVLERQFHRRATMRASVARTAAARGLIASGVESAADIDKLTAAMREHGVRHDGRQVPLIWANVDGDAEAASPEGRRPQVKITTTLHVEQEETAMALARAAASDRTGALTPEQIDRAVRRVSERDGLDFTDGHGLEQRRVIDALGTAGRFAVAVGVAGAGKTTLLRPLVEAWTSPDDGHGAKDGLRHRAGVAAIRPAGRCRYRASEHHGHRRAAGAGRGRRTGAGPDQRRGGRRTQPDRHRAGARFAASPGAAGLLDRGDRR